MRTNYNRQSRREALCIKAPKPHDQRRSSKQLALTAGDEDLAVVAERIASELELSPELLALLSLEQRPPLTPG